jgi:hypothetical protein
MDLPQDWNEFFRLLSSNRVRFLVVGAHALAANGRPRATADLDIFVEPTRANAKAVGRGEQRPRAEATSVALTPEAMMNLREARRRRGSEASRSRRGSCSRWRGCCVEPCEPAKTAIVAGQIVPTLTRVSRTRSP